MSSADLRPLVRAWNRAKFEERQFPYLAFRPMPFQRTLLERRVKIRIAYGANRGGKTEAAVVDGLQIATGTKHLLYPKGWPEDKRPKKIWAVALDANKARDTLRPKIEKYLGDRIPWRWREADQEFHLPGAVIAIKSQESGFSKAQSADIDHAMFDEQPDELYFREVMKRLIDRNGTCFISVTFIRGASWLYHSYIEPWLEANNGLPIPHNGVLCASQEMTDNVYLDAQAVKDYIATIYDPQEYLVAVKGKVVSLSGLVFPNFDPKKHIFNCLDAEGRCTFKAPKEWRKIRSQDWGLKNPAACAWIGVDAAAGQIHVYREYYEREKTVEAICTDVRALSPADEAYEQDILDPSCWNRNAALTNAGIGDFITLAHLYQQFGIPVIKGSRDESVRIQLMRRLLGNPGDKTPGLLIHACCRNGIREIRRWQFGNDQRPEDKDNHFIDALTMGLAYLETEAGTGGSEWTEKENTYLSEKVPEVLTVARQEPYIVTAPNGDVTIQIRVGRRERSEWEEDGYEYERGRP